MLAIQTKPEAMYEKKIHYLRQNTNILWGKRMDKLLIALCSKKIVYA